MCITTLLLLFVDKWSELAGGERQKAVTFERVTVCVYVYISKQKWKQIERDSLFHSLKVYFSSLISELCSCVHNINWINFSAAPLLIHVMSESNPNLCPFVLIIITIIMAIIVIIITIPMIVWPSFATLHFLSPCPRVLPFPLIFLCLHKLFAFPSPPLKIGCIPWERQRNRNEDWSVCVDITFEKWL